MTRGRGAGKRRGRQPGRALRASSNGACGRPASPHHTASAVALVGGGSPPRPGEISLAHHGVLFLDEFPEFPRAALEALREPLETGTITIARAARRAEFPARFQLIAAMNPCPCGYLGSPLKACRCTPDQVARYQGKLSGPLLDRIDLHIEVPAVSAQRTAGRAAPARRRDSIRDRAARRARARPGAPGQAQPGAAGRARSTAMRRWTPAALQLPAHGRDPARLVGAQHAPRAQGGAHHRRPGRRRRRAGGARGGGGAVPAGAAVGGLRTLAPGVQPRHPARARQGDELDRAPERGRGDAAKESAGGPGMKSLHGHDTVACVCDALMATLPPSCDPSTSATPE